MTVKRANWLCWLVTWQHRAIDRDTVMRFHWHRRRRYVKISPRWGLEVTERGLLALGAHHHSQARHKRASTAPPQQQESTARTGETLE